MEAEFPTVEEIWIVKMEKKCMNSLLDLEVSVKINEEWIDRSIDR